MKKRYFLLLLMLVILPHAIRAQTPTDTSAARAAAAELNARIKSLTARSDSLKKAADLLNIRADSILTASGLATPPEPNRWKGSFGLGYTLNRGNSDQTSLVSTLEFERAGISSRFKSNNSVTSTSGSGKETNKGAFKNKFELNQSQRFFYFAALDLDYNRQAGVDLRLAPGVGVGISAVARRKCRLAFNLGVNPITEYLRGRPDETKGYYLASEDLSLVLNSRTRLDQSITWKPRFDRTEDYLLNLSVAMTNKLAADFDLKLNLETRYDSRPPERDPPVKRQDWMFYTSIAYNLW